MYKILICDDDPIFQISIKQTLQRDYECRFANGSEEALDLIKTHPFDLLLLDIQMKNPEEGLHFIPKALKTAPDLNIVMCSSHKDFQIVLKAIRLGATDYLVKDSSADELLYHLKKVIERKLALMRQNRQNLESYSEHFKHVLIGESPSILQLRRTIEKARISQANLLITGETGTGKELIARQLRQTFQDGSLEPFLSVDSATIQSSTAESQLFGHERGAFTGADRLKKGIFEEADQGLVYFDEISNMHLDIQAKLLRVLQEKEVCRLGSARVIPLRFRVLCATNRNLEKMADEGTFKYDLLQRLNAIIIHAPALRERKEDIPLLIDHFIKNQHRVEGPIQFNTEAVAALQEYLWPGNVRELNNLITNLSVMSETSEIQLVHLPPKFLPPSEIRQSVRQPLPRQSTGFYKKVAEFEEKVLRQEYDQSSGNVTQLALALEMNRTHLYSKLKGYSILPPR